MLYRQDATDAFLLSKDDPMHRMLLPLSLLFAVPAALAATPGTAAPVKGISFEHHDWEIACDNTRTCRAAGYHDEGVSPEGMSVLLTRAAGPGTPVHVKVQFAEFEAAPTTPVHLLIDGRDLGVVKLDEASDDDLTADQRTALLSALRRTATITFREDGPRGWVLSGRGASAVMLKMDEFQGRLGTPGALVRRGKRDEATVLAAVAKPQVRHVMPLANRPGDDAIGTQPGLREALSALVTDESCDDLLDPERQGPIHIRRLDNTRVLATSRCWMGAYNYGVGAWVINAKPPYAPVLVTTSSSSFDDGRLVAGQKGRGPGDCFWLAEWVWDGRQVVQTEDKTTGKCRGIALGGAWDLPTVTAEVVQ